MLFFDDFWLIFYKAGSGSIKWNGFGSATLKKTMKRVVVLPLKENLFNVWHTYVLSITAAWEIQENLICHKNNFTIEKMLVAVKAFISTINWVYKRIFNSYCKHLSWEKSNIDFLEVLHIAHIENDNVQIKY